MHARILPILFVSMAASASAQLDDPTGSNSAMESWRTRFGSRWSMHVDPLTNRAEMIYGGRAQWNGVPRADEEWIARAQIAISESSGMHGVDVATLVADRVQLLPLGMIGSGDKWSVDLHQEIG